MKSRTRSARPTGLAGKRSGGSDAFSTPTPAPAPTPVALRPPATCPPAPTATQHGPVSSPGCRPSGAADDSSTSRTSAFPPALARSPRRRGPVARSVAHRGLSRGSWQGQAPRVLCPDQPAVGSRLPPSLRRQISTNVKRKASLRPSLLWTPDLVASGRRPKTLFLRTTLLIRKSEGDGCGVWAGLSTRGAGCWPRAADDAGPAGP